MHKEYSSQSACFSVFWITSPETVFFSPTIFYFIFSFNGPWQFFFVSSLSLSLMVRWRFSARYRFHTVLALALRRRKKTYRHDPILSWYRPSTLLRFCCCFSYVHSWLTSRRTHRVCATVGGWSHFCNKQSQYTCTRKSELLVHLIPRDCSPMEAKVFRLESYTDRGEHYLKDEFLSYLAIPWCTSCIYLSLYFSQRRNAASLPSETVSCTNTSTFVYVCLNFFLYVYATWASEGCLREKEEVTSGHLQHTTVQLYWNEMIDTDKVWHPAPPWPRSRSPTSRK